MERLRQKAIRFGALDLKRSTRQGKKFMVYYKGRWIHFGATSYSDFTKHKDTARRRRYRQRHREIKLKDGRAAYKTKTSPAFWSWHLLW